MSCCGENHKELKSNRPAPSGTYKIMPYEPCAFCAEKHVSDAWELSRECGYETPNRQSIIGALVNAERHLWANEKWRPLHSRIRAARHLVQERKESKIEWTPLLLEIDQLASEAAKELK